MHYEALTENGKKIFPLLAKFPEFYLAGGTALALQLGHRVSEDFDLFCDNTLATELLSRVETEFSGFSVRALVNNSDQLTIIAGEVKVTFLRYPFPLLKQLLVLNSIKVLDAAEIAMTKTYTVGRRGTLKDYVDLYFAVSQRIISLSDLLGCAEKKYGDVFNSRLFLEQLVFLDDVPDAQINFLKEVVSKTDIREFFESEIKKLSW